jgi:hypothetical protein
MSVQTNLKDLLENLYVIPEMVKRDRVLGEKVEADEDNSKQKMVEGNWGPTLVEKRAGRFQGDGRTVFEKAQERKKICNMECAKGRSKNYNSFNVLSAPVIDDLAKDVGISLGVVQSAREQSIASVLDSDNCRIDNFDRNCTICQSELENRNDSDNLGELIGDDAPATPVNQPIIPQVEEDEASKGQWTFVVNRKKIEDKVIQ